MLAVALLAALSGPVQQQQQQQQQKARVCVEGGDAVAEFVKARLVAAGTALVDPQDADVRVKVRTLADGAVRVVVEDRRGVVAERTIERTTDADVAIAAWLVVRDAIERIESEGALGSSPLQRSPIERAPIPLSVDVLAGVAPDVAFQGTSFLPLTVVAGARFDVAPSLRVVAQVGYSAGISGDTILHSVPVRLAAEAWGDAGVVEWAAGARASTAPSLAVSGGRAGGGVGAAVSAYGRLAFPFNATFAAVAEVGVESKLVRQAVLTDSGVHEEPLFAAPLAVGIEVRL